MTVISKLPDGNNRANVEVVVDTAINFHVILAVNIKVEIFFYLLLYVVTQSIQINNFSESFNSFQASVAFHKETSYLLCRAKKMTGFYMKRNTELKWIKESLRKKPAIESLFNKSWNVPKICNIFLYNTFEQLFLKSPITTILHNFK